MVKGGTAKDTAAVEPGGRRAPPISSTKYHWYLELVENKDKKMKKLKFETTEDKMPPPGFEFVPMGNPDLTQTCKELSREQGAPIMIVNFPTPPSKAIQPPPRDAELSNSNAIFEELGKHLNRLGYHFRASIVDEARRQLAATLGHEVPNQEVVPGQPEPIPANQEEVNRQADAAIRDLFPRIPHYDRQSIINHSFSLKRFQNKERTVGLAAKLPLSKRVQLAVWAHIRHNFTRYDQLLRETSRPHARSLVDPLCLDLLIRWRGDEETGRDQLDEILREVIVLSDTESEDEDTEDDDDLSSDARDNPSRPPVRDMGQGLLGRTSTVEETRKQNSIEQTVSEATDLAPRPGGAPYRIPLVSLTGSPRASQTYQTTRDQAWQQAVERAGDRWPSDSETPFVTQPHRLLPGEGQHSRLFSRRERQDLPGGIDSYDREDHVAGFSSHQRQARAVTRFAQYHVNDGINREIGCAARDWPNLGAPMPSQTIMYSGRSGAMFRSGGYSAPRSPLLSQTRLDSPYEVWQAESGGYLQSHAARDALHSHSARQASHGFVPVNGYERGFLAPRPTHEFPWPSVERPVQQTEEYVGRPRSLVGSRWEVIQSPTHDYGSFANTSVMPAHRTVHSLAMSFVQDENAARQSIRLDVALPQDRRMLQDAVPRQHFVEVEESRVGFKRAAPRDFVPGPDAYRYAGTRSPSTRRWESRDYDNGVPTFYHRQQSVRQSSVGIIPVRNKFPPRYEALPVSHRLQSEGRHGNDGDIFIQPHRPLASVETSFHPEDRDPVESRYDMRPRCHGERALYYEAAPARRDYPAACERLG